MSISIQQITYIHADKEILFKDLTLSVNKGQKIALIGNNGSGKSTLLQIIAGWLPPSSGTVVRPDDIYYIPQHFGQYDGQTIAQALRVEKKIEALHAILNGDVSVENFNTLDEDWDIEERIQSALESWGLGDKTASLPLCQLSGGEKTRVFLAGMEIHSPSVILLDEPTNHLDISSREALEDALAGYEGTMLIVSHDRYFINKIANRVLHLTHDGVKEYLGGYDDYVQALEEQPPTPKAAQEKPKQNAYKLRKERESERRKITGRVARCEEKIARMDEEITTLNAQLERPEIAADYARVLELTQQLASLHEEQERLYAQWEQLQEQLEADDNA